MKRLLLIINLSFVFGCARNYTGLYYDSCLISHRPSVSLKLKPDNEFEYKFTYYDTLVTGTWRSSHDTLILKSKMFLIPRKPLSPAIKYTETDGSDRFTIVGKKLIPITDDNTTNSKRGCYLRRQ